MPEYKVCPQCASRILAEGTPDICDECDVPYITEKAMAEKKVAEEATRKKIVKAKTDYQETIDKARGELDEVLSDI